jgi:tRNA threonylcarbamoyl adenosine modification protein (Sua5/YciO/YrdC/YwlC family)
VKTLSFIETEEIVKAIREAARVVGDGGVVMIPTESFYGLGADPRCANAVARIIAMKGRPQDLGLPVLGADWQQIESLVRVPERFRAKLSRLWPAALTVILPCVNPVPAGRDQTIAIRIPAHESLRALLYKTGPLTATSANRHGEPPFTTTGESLGSLVEKPDLVVDAGPTEGGEPSTMVDLCGVEPTIVRHGPVRWEDPILKISDGV